MRILLLGAQGMLGQALQATFAQFEVTAWDRAELDITDAFQVQERVGQLKPDVIINAAAYTNVDDAENNEAAAFAVNHAAVENIAKAAFSIQAAVVHYSTDYVFPGTSQAGYREDDEPGPAINVYGSSKLAGEKILQQINPRFYLIRTAWLYGPGGKNFVDTMLSLAKVKPELAVVNDQHGSPTFTYDVASFTRELLTEKFPKGIYHAVNRGMTTWYAFAKKIFEQKNIAIGLKPVTSSQFPRPAARPKYSMLINTKGPTFRSWEAALDDYLTSYQA